MNLALIILVLSILLSAEANENWLRNVLKQLFERSNTPSGSDIQKRIYNGTTATEGQFPYIVSLIIISETGKILLCGGSIIDHTWILTAAHCTYTARSIKIFYGSTKIAKGKIWHEVGSDKIIVHDEFDDKRLGNDIALIQTPHVDFSDLINKVELADHDKDSSGLWAVASGWGDTSNEGNFATDLQYANFKILSKKECWKAITGKSDNIICIKPAENKTVGKGDSGGPLVTRDDPKLVGVSSFILNDNINIPAGFTSVSAYRDWIDKHTGI